MRTMVEGGVVVNVQGGTAFVKFKRSSACGNCKACGMLKDMSEIVIDMPNIAGAAVGDRVMVSFSGAKSLKSSVIAYVFPLIMLFIGVFLGYSIGKWINLDVPDDLIAAISGILFTVVAFLAIKLLDPILKNKLEGSFQMIHLLEESEEQQNE